MTRFEKRIVITALGWSMLIPNQNLRHCRLNRCERVKGLRYLIQNARSDTLLSTWMGHQRHQSITNRKLSGCGLEMVECGAFSWARVLNSVDRYRQRSELHWGWVLTGWGSEGANRNPKASYIYLAAFNDIVCSLQRFKLTIIKHQDLCIPEYPGVDR